MYKCVNSQSVSQVYVKILSGVGEVCGVECIWVDNCFSSGIWVEVWSVTEISAVITAISSRWSRCSTSPFDS